jgi:hypothetical protein
VLFAALLFVAPPSFPEEIPELPPWKTNTPVVQIKKELYKQHPKPGAAALTSVFYVGPKLERMEIHASEIRDDVPSDPMRRFSKDNGRTWSPFESLPPTLS